MHMLQNSRGVLFLWLAKRRRHVSWAHQAYKHIQNASHLLKMHINHHQFKMSPFKYMQSQFRSVPNHQKTSENNQIIENKQKSTTKPHSIKWSERPIYHSTLLASMHFGFK